LFEGIKIQSTNLMIEKVSKINKLLLKINCKYGLVGEADERLLELNSDRLCQTLNGSVRNLAIAKDTFVKLPPIILLEFTGYKTRGMLTGLVFQICGQPLSIGIRG